MKCKPLLQSFKYALSGLWYAASTQRNMKIHLAMATSVTVLAWYFNFSTVEFTILFLTIGAVIVAEMINTALEAAVDLASPALHPLAKIAKDVAAGAVLISAILSLIIGFLLFWPHIRG